jgi:sensor domain CHASE-containing protein
MQIKQHNYSAIPEINPLNTELNSICHLLALLEVHPILHISRVRVKALDFITTEGELQAISNCHCPNLAIVDVDVSDI